MLLVVPSEEVKSNILSRTITRAVLSLNQLASSEIEEGVAGVALPPPVVPAAAPKGVPTARALGIKESARAKNVADTERRAIMNEEKKLY